MKVNQFLPSIFLFNLHGINGIILELSDHLLVRGGFPQVYYSTRENPTEGRYAQIEKESLASTRACERFSDYLIGKTFHIETDHKPLASLLGNKSQTMTNLLTQLSLYLDHNVPNTVSNLALS
jgi:hypothetical protein